MFKTPAALGTGRRVATVLLATPLLAAAYWRASGVPVTGLTVPWLLLGLTAAAVGAAVLASYVPASGWRPDLGCSPCAAVAGLSLVGSVLAIGNYGASLVGPALACAVTLFAVTQRLGPATCETQPVAHPEDLRDR